MRKTNNSEMYIFNFRNFEVKNRAKANYVYQFTAFVFIFSQQEPQQKLKQERRQSHSSILQIIVVFLSLVSIFQLKIFKGQLFN